MAVKKVSRNGKGYFATYKNVSQVYKNKVRKLERHLKACPEDEQAKAALERIKKNGYNGRTAPSRNGSRVVHLGKGTMSLNTLDGRLSSMGREYQGLQRLARVADKEQNYLPKAEREAQASRNAQLVGDKPKQRGGRRRAKANKAK